MSVVPTEFGGCVFTLLSRSASLADEKDKRSLEATVNDKGSERSLHLVIVSGLSGSGKTQALKCLEDIGFFCVDNLPPALFLAFAEFCGQRSHTVRKIALCIDIRARDFFRIFSKISNGSKRVSPSWNCCIWKRMMLS